MKKVLYLLVIVCSFVFSCNDIIDEVNITNDIVTILAPSNGATLTDTNITFTWNPIDGADAYQLQIATPDFVNATSIVLDSTLTITAYAKILSSGDYQWRVRAKNANYQTAYTTQSLTINESDPIDISTEQLVLLAPANDTSFTIADTINFSWDTIVNADSYVFQIATPNFVSATEIIENETMTTTSFSVSNLTAQSYEWRVKAINTSSETAYTFQSFTIAE